MALLGSNYNKLYIFLYRPVIVHFPLPDAVSLDGVSSSQSTTAISLWCLCAALYAIAVGSNPSVMYDLGDLVYSSMISRSRVKTNLFANMILVRKHVRWTFRFTVTRFFFIHRFIAIPLCSESADLFWRNFELLHIKQNKERQREIVSGRIQLLKTYFRYSLLWRDLSHLINKEDEEMLEDYQKWSSKRCHQAWANASTREFLLSKHWFQSDAISCSTTFDHLSI